MDRKVEKALGGLYERRTIGGEENRHFRDLGLVSFTFHRCCFTLTRNFWNVEYSLVRGYHRSFFLISSIPRDYRAREPLPLSLCESTLLARRFASKGKSKGFQSLHLSASLAESKRVKLYNESYLFRLCEISKLAKFHSQVGFLLSPQLDWNCSASLPRLLCKHLRMLSSYLHDALMLPRCSRSNRPTRSTKSNRIKQEQEGDVRLDEGV